MNYTVQQEAVQCQWPHGCMARTTDPSMMCHHHRRFSPSIWSDSGEVVRSGRLDSTIKLVSADRQFQQEVMTQARDSMDHQPRIVIHPYNQNAMIITNVAHRPFRIYGTQVEPPYEDDTLVIIQNEGTNDLIVASDDIQDAHELLTELQKGVQEVSSIHHADEFDLYDGVAEEYDDTSEIISQLDLGASSSVKLVLSSPNEMNGEMFRITPEDPVHQPEVTGLLLPVFPAITDQGEVVTAYQVHSVEANMPVSETPYQSVLGALEEVRTLVAQKAIVHPETGKLYLPRGWTDQ